MSRQKNSSLINEHARNREPVSNHSLVSSVAQASSARNEFVPCAGAGVLLHTTPASSYLLLLLPLLSNVIFIVRNIILQIIIIVFFLSSLRAGAHCFNFHNMIS